MNLSMLIERYPRLFHMAEKGSWPSIKANGLLSTTAALDRFDIQGAYRRRLESQHRDTKTLVGSEDAGIVLRDQKPMPPPRLQAALVDGTTPGQWYEALNRRVFLWARESRLLGLLGAREYREVEHDVLTIDTRSLMQKYEHNTWLCRMNSGNTWPFPLPRSLADFMRISDYPTKPRSGAPAKEVVEVVVDYSIPDIAEHVLEVRRMKETQVVATLPL